MHVDLSSYIKIAHSYSFVFFSANPIFTIESMSVQSILFCDVNTPPPPHPAFSNITVHCVFVVNLFIYTCKFVCVQMCIFQMNTTASDFQDSVVFYYYFKQSQINNK